MWWPIFYKIEGPQYSICRLQGPSVQINESWWEKAQGSVSTEQKCYGLRAIYKESIIPGDYMKTT